MAAPPVAPRGAHPFTPASPTLDVPPVPQMGAALAPLVDTHVHLTDRRYAGDLEAVLDRARAAGVIRMVVVGYDLASSEASIGLAARYPDVWAAVGIHPHNARDASESALSRLDELSQTPRVVAIGECGLDFYRNLSPAATQRQAFRAQLEIAARRDLPVIIHSRDAMPDTLSILEERRSPAARSSMGSIDATDAAGVKGVMHCFDGTREDAARVIALGLHISCAGTLTYRKDQTLAQAIASVPEDRLVVETDCPYLTPEGHRGERNEPAHVQLVAQAAARVRGVGFEQMARQTTHNALRLFGLPAFVELPNPAEMLAGAVQ